MVLAIHAHRSGSFQGYGKTDEKRMHEDFVDQFEVGHSPRFFRHERERHHDIVHEGIYAQTENRSPEKEPFQQEGQEDTRSLVHGGRADCHRKVEQYSKQYRGPAMVESFRSQEPAGDVLEDASRRDSDCQTKKQHCVKAIKHAGQQAAHQDCFEGAGSFDRGQRFGSDHFTSDRGHSSGCMLPPRGQPSLLAAPHERKCDARDAFVVHSAEFHVEKDARVGEGLLRSMCCAASVDHLPHGRGDRLSSLPASFRIRNRLVRLLAPCSRMLAPESCKSVPPRPRLPESRVQSRT
jgi:hypothetical protein